jgi:hypothetical protein
MLRSVAVFVARLLERLQAPSGAWYHWRNLVAWLGLAEYGATSC